MTERKPRKPQVKRKRRAVNGILLLDKPLNFTSSAALQKVRWLFEAEKAGHTGNLDPLATGVLPLCFGEATKFSQYLLEADKGYETLIQLGVTTATGDAEGEVLAQREVGATQADLENLLPEFRGAIKQIPPMYSALKKDGQPLYKLAREGKTVEREPRTVTIHSLELLSFDQDKAKARLSISCSKGTYIRTLAEDIGERLGCGAHVAELVRTKAGPFELSQCLALDDLIRLQEEKGAAALDEYLLPVDTALQDLPLVKLSTSSAFYWLHGQPVRAPNAPKFGLLRVQNAEGEFIGIGEISEDGRIAPRRLIRSA